MNSMESFQEITGSELSAKESREIQIARNLGEQGFSFFDFTDAKALQEIVDLVELRSPTPLSSFHESTLTLDEQMSLIKSLTDEIEKSQLVNKLLQGERNLFSYLLGADVDIQSRPHLRISRPKAESELIGWHRDSFYGNSPLEMNIWFPLMPLREGAGLALVPGSHREGSTNVRFVEEQDSFKKNVTKGSVANTIGFVYAPKTDDSIANLDPKNVRVLRPQFGKGIIFFGCMIHRGQNLSSRARASVDTRVKHALTATQTKDGYYMPLYRGVISDCSQEFQKLSSGEQQ